MAADAGTGGLSAFGWVVVAGGVAVAGAAGLYFSGILKPEAEVEQGVAEAAKPAESEFVAESETSQQPAKEVEIDTASVQPAESEPEAEPEAEPEIEPEAESVAEPEAEPEVNLAAPALDTIRIEPDGTTLLSGKAAPGSALVVLLNGQEIERTTVDRSGAFALFLTLPFSDTPRGLSLTSEHKGQVAQSDDYIVAALPDPQPVHVAEANTQPEDNEPETDVESDVVASTGSVQTPDTTVDESAGDKSETADVSNTSQQAVPDVEQTQTTETTMAEATVAEPASEPADDSPTLNVADASSDGSETQVVSPDSSEAKTEDSVPTTAESDVGDQQQEIEQEQQTDEQEQPQVVAILKSDEEGVELVQAPSSTNTATVAPIALDTIGYSEEGEVQLTGRATQGALVRVYLNNLAVSDLIADVQGRWRGELEDVSPGIYTLRLDELGPGDVVLSRLETPFKREAPEVLVPREPSPSQSPETPAIRAVTVQKGDTLWAISRERYGDGVLYVKVFDANRGAIRNPDLIYPGQVFNIPD